MTEVNEKFEIKNRFSNAVVLTAEITCRPDASYSIKLGLAVKWAAKSRADLSRANLSWADLSGADLSWANLSRADLSRADLSWADLSGADLSWANLSGADLSGADLSGADLSWANLSRAKGLSEEALRPFKADLFLTILSLRAVPTELRHLIAKLRAGQIDGSTYDGINDCACLVGTIAQPRGGFSAARLDHGSRRPAEAWFAMIRPGDVPGKVGEDGKETGGGYAAQKALEWSLELCMLLGVDPEVADPPMPEAA